MSERKRFYAEKLLSDLIALYQTTGLVVWGQIQGAPGTYQKLLVQSDGTVVVTGAISGTVDVSDRANRLLGIAYGDVGQLLQRPTTRDLLVQIRNAGAEIDPRAVRALVKATDELYSVLRTDAGVAYDARDRNWTITENLNRAWSLAKASDNVYAVLKTDAGVALDPRDRNWTVTEALARSWVLSASDIVTAYGSQTQALLQRATTYDLIVQLRSAGAEIDPRSIRALVKTTDELYSVLRTDAGVAYDARQTRALTSTDIITVYGSQTQALQQKATTYELLVDEVDRASRLVGIVYGSQSQQLLQRASTYDLLVALRQAGSELSTSNPLFAGIVDASGNRMPSMDASTRPGYVDEIDRAGRLLGKVYGNQDVLQQRATTKELLVEISYQGTEKDPTQIRPLTSSDIATVQQTARTSLTVKPEREDNTSYAVIISPNAAGVQLIAGSGVTKIKVKKWGYHSVADGQHFFYFGTSTTAPTLSATPTAKVFGVSLLKGHYRQTSTDPDVGAAGDGLYFYSANLESNMSVDWQSVQE